MEFEAAQFDALLRTCLAHEASSELAVLGAREHPTDDVTAEDVEHDARGGQYVPFSGPSSLVMSRTKPHSALLREAPASHIADDASALVARALLDWPRENAVHRTRRADVRAFIEQRRDDFLRTPIDESFRVQTTREVALDVAHARGDRAFVRSRGTVGRCAR